MGWGWGWGGGGGWGWGRCWGGVGGGVLRERMCRRRAQETAEELG